MLSEVVLTDCHTAVLKNLEHNVVKNLHNSFTTVEEDPLELRLTEHLYVYLQFVVEYVEVLLLLLTTGTGAMS